jgi:hypothetical protein
MRQTGVFATEEQVEALKASLKQPYLVVGGVPPESPQRLAHRYALAQGLPEIAGYYGCDLKTGEFVAS